MALVPECYPKVKTKGDEDIVKVREAVVRTIDNLPKEAANNSRSKDSHLQGCEDEATQNWLLEVTGGLWLHR